MEKITASMHVRGWELNSYVDCSLHLGPLETRQSLSQTTQTLQNSSEGKNLEGCAFLCVLQCPTSLCVLQCSSQCIQGLKYYSLCSF